MNNNPAVPVSMKFFCIAIILLLQLPAISPALDLGRLATVGSQSETATAPFTVFTNAASISVADKAAAGPPNGISSPYPSQIAVSGLLGTISDVNVTISGINANRPRDLEFALVSPTGQALKLMADAGDLTAMAGVVLTFDDAAATAVPTGGGSSIPTGTYRPTDFFFSAGDPEDFPAPGPAAPGIPAPTGTATLASIFNGLSPNGNWSLFIMDDSLGGGASSVTSGWSIDITTAGGGVPTTTTVSSNTNPALTTQTITFTSLTTSAGNPVTVGNVTFTNNGVNIVGCINIAMNGSGNAACMTTLAEGTRTIGANYNGSGGFGVSGGTMSQVVNSPTVISGTGTQFCNNGGFTIADPGSATVYPSNISVSGLFGTISKVTIQLNNMNVPRTANLDFLLVGPGGQAFQMMSDTGDSVTPVNPLNITLDDAAASQLPNGTPVSSGTFRPTDYALGGADSYPAPAPGVFTLAAPAGTGTFASIYNSTNPNGNWSLYSVDDSIGGGTTLVSGWCANFTLAKFATTTTTTSSQNPTLTGQSVTFTATVAPVAPGTGTPGGTVEFFDGVTLLGNAALNGAGQATLTTSALASGARNINATYQGSNVGGGGGGYNTSSGGLVQNVNTTAVWDGSASSDWNNLANWTTNLVPNSTHGVNLPSGALPNEP